MKVGVVASNFYPKISKMLIDGAISKLKKNKISNFEIITGISNTPGTVISEHLTPASTKQLLASDDKLDEISL